MRKGPNDDAIHLISLISLLYCFMPSVGRLKSLRSGPICMTELQQDEENDETSVFPFFHPTTLPFHALSHLCLKKPKYLDICFAVDLPPSRLEAVLSASDLCGPPLRALTLQPKDKANLSLWFKSLWSLNADSKNRFYLKELAKDLI